MKRLHTSLCDLLGVDYPMIQAGMGYVSGAELAAAVSNAGGMGVIGGAHLGSEELRAEIRKAKSLTPRPFGVDLIFPARGKEALAGLKLPPSLPAPILQAREELEKRGVQVREETVEDVEADVYMGAELARKKAEVVLEEGVALLALGLGTPPWLVKEAHSRGMKVVSLVGNVKNALQVEAMGVDLIVAQGHEAGGHVGRIPTFVLVPQVVDAVRVPVLAAGGIVDGRGIVAALALGACGVWIGTRFVPTPESAAHPFHKSGILSANERSTIYTRVYDGLGHRHLRTRFDELWEGYEAEILPFPHQRALTAPIYDAARQAGIGDFMAMSAGMGSAMVKEEKSAGEIVREMVAEAMQVLEGRLSSVVKE